MKKVYYFSITPLILGIICFISFVIIGSKIAPDGTLIEPFGLIPIGFLFIALGSIMTLVISIWSLFHNPKKFDKWAFGLSFGFIVLVMTYLYISISYLSQRANEEISVNNRSTDTSQTPVYSQNFKDIKNITYYINDEAVNLVNGKEEKIIATDSESKQITQYFGNESEFQNIL